MSGVLTFDPSKTACSQTWVRSLIYRVLLSTMLATTLQNPCHVMKSCSDSFWCDRSHFFPHQTLRCRDVDEYDACFSVKNWLIVCMISVQRVSNHFRKWVWTVFGSDNLNNETNNKTGSIPQTLLWVNHVNQPGACGYLGFSLKFYIATS